MHLKVFCWNEENMHNWHDLPAEVSWPGSAKRVVAWGRVAAVDCLGKELTILDRAPSSNLNSHWQDRLTPWKLASSTFSAFDYLLIISRDCPL